MSLELHAQLHAQVYGMQEAGPSHIERPSQHPLPNGIATVRPCQQKPESSQLPFFFLITPKPATLQVYRGRAIGAILSVQAAEVIERKNADSDISRIMMAGKLNADFPAADQPEELSTQARGWQLKVIFGVHLPSLKAPAAFKFANKRVVHVCIEISRVELEFRAIGHNILFWMCILVCNLDLQALQIPAVWLIPLGATWGMSWYFCCFAIASW